VSIDAGVFTLAGPPEALAREGAGFFYASFVLPPKAYAAMLDDLAALLERGGGPGVFHMPVNRLVVGEAG